MLSLCKCSDVDECAANTDGCEHICINTIGSFECSCLPGYMLNSDNQTCTGEPLYADVHGKVSYDNYVIVYFFSDIDECEKDSGGCEHGLCSNINGSFECSCRDGYHLDHDGRSCNGKSYCNQCGGVAACHNIVVPCQAIAKCKFHTKVHAG